MPVCSGCTLVGETWNGELLGSAAFGSDANLGPMVYLGHTWSGTDWAGHTWSGNRWSGHTWSGNRWSDGGWVSDSWTGNRWSGHSWRDQTWG